MKRIKVNPANLLATEGTDLDMNTVRKYYAILRGGKRVDPVVVVREPNNGYYYPADGNHTSYARLLAKRDDVEAILLETDDDVKNHGLGETKRFTTLAELLEYCREQNDLSSRELGVTYICDYAALSNMRLN